MEVLSIVLGAVCAIFGALIAVIIPIIYNNRETKIGRRTKLSLGIWNNNEDDIEERLNDRHISWFMKLENIDDYTDKHDVLFFNCVITDNSVMHDVYFKIENGSYDEKHYIGTLSKKRGAVIPLKIDNKSNDMLCD